MDCGAPGLSAVMVQLCSGLPDRRSKRSEAERSGAKRSEAERSASGRLRSCTNQLENMDMEVFLKSRPSAHVSRVAALIDGSRTLGAG